jgi:curved DNA-binding protein
MDISMEYKDYYQVMGVAKTASQVEIKRAYKKLARKLHPDVSKVKNAEVQFKELGEAYEVLKDPEKRAAYDQLGENWQSGQPFSPPPDWDQGFEYSDIGRSPNFSDFFESIFGQTNTEPSGKNYRSDQGHQERGEDHHAKINIDIEDAFHGVTRTVTLHSPEMDAQGHVSTRERQLKIKIPMGITQDQQIRLEGQGYSLAGHKKGDLYLQIQFNSHPLFRVDGKNIELDLPITPWEAALGATINAPTPAGKIDLKIPANSKSNSKLRINGRGIPGKPCGDLFAFLKIVLPDGNSEKAKKLYKKMAKELAFNPRKKLGM